ncbi:unnamed protein product [Meloidogyne enterolobii]|uniref:Uncharacterized protein n=1 Tax=Meloidogyne enterolobii TaxID=390850 RepID=A0ACB0Z788_MELEN
MKGRKGRLEGGGKWRISTRHTSFQPFIYFLLFFTQQRNHWTYKQLFKTFFLFKLEEETKKYFFCFYKLL